MRIRTSKRLMKVASDGLLRTLFSAASMFLLCGCAVWGTFLPDDTVQTAPAMSSSMYASAPAWGASPTAYGTPPWGGAPGTYGTPAFGGAPENYGAPAWGVAQSVYSTPAPGPAPTVYGSRLHVPPGESAAGRVLALTEQTAAAKAENDRLAERIRGLEAEVEAGQQALARATDEVMETRKELTNARTDLERWKQEIATLRERLGAADKDNLSTLQSTVVLLQQLLAHEHPPTDGEQ
jgi:hypothetical protein